MMHDNQHQPNIVLFDADDTLWGLSERVAEHVGVPYNRLSNFHVLENELLTLEQRRAVNEAYRTRQIFEDIEFYSGAERIFELEQYGVRVQIYSNSFSEEVCNLKLQQFLRLYPGITSDKLHLNIINEHTTLRGKYVGPNVLCLVDDGPYNIASSQAQYNLVPFTPWNITAEAVKIMASVPHEYCIHGDINVAIDKIIKMIHHTKTHP